ncbi:MAG TPA: S1/P1 nuclease [Rhizomicrobium sp.]|nr:S1/P1 nuclease [Rhizomicrobium sp.]
MFSYNAVKRLCCILALLVSCETPAVAWGPQGHMLVGSLATDLLTSNARKHVKSILGYSLATAAKWPDCVRSVVRHTDGTFEYVVNPQYQPPCDAFMKPKSEVRRMEDYASRNWDNCDGDGGSCAATYHFADIPIDLNSYGANEIGAADHDVVHAIQAATAVLQDQAAPAPFSIKDKKEALLLIAHFVGDIHQPLHVGSIYLTSNGTPANPSDAAEAKSEFTRGGNFICLKTTNLHSEWDAIPATWDVDKISKTRRAKFLSSAQAVPKSTGPLQVWPETWATDSIGAAKTAFTGLSFSPTTGKCQNAKWDGSADDSKAYAGKRKSLQEKRIESAAARLAQLLNAVWP